MAKSRFVCDRCGLAVTTWGSAGTWKHRANQHSRSCGRPPLVVERAQYEAEARALAAAVQYALDNRIGGTP